MMIKGKKQQGTVVYFAVTAQGFPKNTEEIHGGRLIHGEPIPGSPSTRSTISCSDTTTGNLSTVIKRRYC